jgi:hypothetical protein
VRVAVVEPKRPQCSVQPDRCLLAPSLGECACQGATSATPDNRESAHPATASELREKSAQPPTADDVCRALKQSAAENALPVEFFAGASSELASASNPFDLCLHHPLNYAGQVFVQP